MKDFKKNTLEIVMEKDENGIVMSWKGQSDERNPSKVLDPYLDSCIKGLKGSNLTIEFSSLEYMNSSTVSPIIQFLKNLNAASVPTLVTYNKNSKWQAASFKALQTFSRMLPHLTVEGR